MNHPLRSAQILAMVLLSWLGSRAHAEEVPSKPQQQAHRFETQVAPILSRHCLECHGAGKTEGGLNLSRKQTALAGGDSGKVIHAGNSADSLLWTTIESGEMPPKRAPLSAEEKKIIQSWIEEGAVWTREVIDPGSHLVKQSSEVWVQRLTLVEYITTVREITGVDVASEAKRLLPPDVRADGFSNTAYSQTIDLSHVQAYHELAQRIVQKMDCGEFAARFADCRSFDEGCLSELIQRMGKRVLRGPLDPWEVESYQQIAQAVQQEKGTYEEAVGYILEGMLQSPRFIYRIEKPNGDKPSQYELASRLGYILWGAPPDEDLIHLADAGKLKGAELEALVQRMLTDPRAKARSAQFVHEWLELERLDSLRPNEKLYPAWSPALGSDMQDETLAFFDEVAWQQQRPLADLLNAQVTVVSPRLARFYGLKATQGQPLAGARQTAGTSSGVLAYYDFSEGSGDVVHDRSRSDSSLYLKIQSPENVRWTSDGLVVHKPTRIFTTEPPRPMTAALRKTNQITIEAWITPHDLQQNGPARIVTFSHDTSSRNFTLGQEKKKYDARLRTNKTDRNGMPSISTKDGQVKTQRTHVVYTKDDDGVARLYIDGKLAAERKGLGDFSNWESEMVFGLANEVTGDRPWLGTLHSVAIYDRALSAEEVIVQYEPIRKYDLAWYPERGGILTQGSTLTLGGDNASMVSRGLFVLHELLYSHVGAPPPCVDTSPVPTKKGLTQRGIAMERINNASCGGCHSRFEPLAFGLEKFDGIGAFSDKDRFGNPLRDDGEILLPGTEEPVKYESSRQLMEILAASDRVRMGITRKLVQFAISRPLASSDEAIVKQIHEQAQAGGGTYQAVMQAIVLSDLVQKFPPSQTSR
ncbi:Planctomycete cytochrome C [Bremerella volcania]|uniref:Planctomycete cytochrome C n=1 Tax=Bremerella volcania TaxID=2527984 RepID=A0A518C8F7_9BACT|nr:DUF1592 domain-containing protein [Bremerella volcania]QDU75490.1 Planctomycete cytochrome C [Bremerella volcania]